MIKLLELTTECSFKLMEILRQLIIAWWIILVVQLYVVIGEQGQLIFCFLGRKIVNNSSYSKIITITMKMGIVEEELTQI